MSYIICKQYTQYSYSVMVWLENAMVALIHARTELIHEYYSSTIAMPFSSAKLYQETCDLATNSTIVMIILVYY